MSRNTEMKWKLEISKVNLARVSESVTEISGMHDKESRRR
jgi:hypothetical protein